MKHAIVLAVLIAIASCKSAPQGLKAVDANPGDAARRSTVVVKNKTASPVVVYVSFGADSVVVPSTWASFCPSPARLNCQFPLAANGSQGLPLNGRYLNATLSFGAPVGCGTTKAELNLNNPKWYDITDVSLVDGYSNKIAIDVMDPSGSRTLGPPNGPSGNEKVYGLYPLNCDICVARQSPPCGASPGTSGCKAGGQYNPKPPCQNQGSVMGGGSIVVVRYLGT
jgi:hypothetical protein